jgi:hypothetical protein
LAAVSVAVVALLAAASPVFAADATTRSTGAPPSHPGIASAALLPLGMGLLAVGVALVLMARRNRPPEYEPKHLA